MRYGNFTAKDTFNSAASGKLSECNEPIIVTGLELSEKPDNNGELTKTATLKTDKGDLFATVSASAIQQIEALADMFDDGETEFNISVIHRKSNAGRDYIQLQLN